MRTPLLTLAALLATSFITHAQPDKKDPAGPVVNGLQLSLKAEPAETSLNGDGKNAKPVTLKLTFTNVSDRPIKFNAFDWRFTRLKGTFKATPADCIESAIAVADRKPVAPQAGDFLEIKPGQSWSAPALAFPGSIPAGPNAFAFCNAKKPGEVRLRFAYNSADLDAPFAKGMWTGELTSNEVTIAIKSAAK